MCVEACVQTKQWQASNPRRVGVCLSEGGPREAYWQAASRLSNKFLSSSLKSFLLPTVFPFVFLASSFGFLRAHGERQVYCNDPELKHYVYCVSRQRCEFNR